MTDREQPDLERALRLALRPVEPRAGFETRVMHALDAAPRPRYRPSLWAFASAAAAACALTAVGTLSYRGHMQALRAEQTRAQALEALRIANDKLATAFRLVTDETDAGGSRPARDDGSGGERQLD